MVVRIWRMDLCTASRKARLAFSIKCHQSATCVAFGSGLAAAYAKAPPRSRETMLIWGWSESQAWAVAGSRSGRSAMVLRRSKS